MTTQIWSQDNFTKGELSPLMYARVTTSQYYNGVKTAQNVLLYPQGGIGKRFGSLYNATLSGFTSHTDIFFQTFQYLNECCYQILFKPDAIDIFLEGLLVATVSATGFDARTVYNLDYTVLDNHFRVSGQGFRPKDLVRAPNSGATITSISANSFAAAAAPFVAGLVYPVRFTVTGGTMIQTTPQIKAGITYFVGTQSTTTAAIYTTAQEAKDDLIHGLVNGYPISGAGTGTTTVIVQNTWSFSNATFKNLPVYDFNGGYDALTFTPSAVSGAAATLTASGAIFTAAHVGGAYVGGGGVARITAFTDSTHVTIAIQQNFDATAPIAGILSLLTEPAWSDTRGWPQKCSSFQNRSLFANTDSLPNGFWASAINDYSDFNDMQTDDDDAISWFPTSDEINFIRFIVPYRSITVHTNSGVYSSPLSGTNAITPNNFSLLLQDSTPADFLQPRAIDNQIIVVSGNDAHTLVWDGINNAYQSAIVSITNEQVIRNPVDEAPFVDLTRAGSRYVLIINENGTLALFQTLITEDVAGWTPSILEQSYGHAQFRQAATNFNGRGWFINERQIAVAAAPINITAFTSSTLTAVASNYSTTVPTAVKFATTGTLPVSSPQIVTGTYYWVIGVTANTFKVYSTQEDALADVNAYVFSSAGTTSTVIGWLLTATFFLEELSLDARLDCATYFDGAPTDTITGLSRFNAQQVKMIGDGFGFEAEGNNNEVVFEAHGAAVQVSTGYVGFPIHTVIEPLPLALSQGLVSPKATALTEPKHIRYCRFMFNDTIGGTINGVPIALRNFNQVIPGDPPIPARGYIEMSIMKGWDDFYETTYTIEHSDPFNIVLLGVFYTVDV